MTCVAHRHTVLGLFFIHFGPFLKPVWRQSVVGRICSGIPSSVAFGLAGRVKIERLVDSETTGFYLNANEHPHTLLPTIGVYVSLSSVCLPENSWETFQWPKQTAFTASGAICNIKSHLERTQSHYILLSFFHSSRGLYSLYSPKSCDSARDVTYVVNQKPKRC